MIRGNGGITSVIGLWFVVCFAAMASADVLPGDVIDQTNWEKAQGLLPESVLNWVKQGDFTLDIDNLNFTVMDKMPQFVQEAPKTNGGKLALDGDGAIVDVGSGKPPQYILGTPFPDLDVADPKVAEKIIHNNKYAQYMIGSGYIDAEGFWLGRSGYERKVGYEARQIVMDGHPGVVTLTNKKRIEKYMLLVMRSPFDISGTSVLLWRFLDPTKQDLNFGYLPAVRRARRMNPANRSDSFLGTDFAVDDTNGYDGKIPAFTWKLLGRKAAIVPWVEPDPARIVQNQAGEWETTSNTVVYGYQKEGWQGAPWAPTNVVWVKREVYVIEAKAKDGYYNYGTQHMWIDTETFNCSYKMINDRAGKYWKTLLLPDWVCESGDNKARFKLVGVSIVMIDERTDHATATESGSANNKMVFGANLDEVDFTLAGFQKYCK